MANVTRASEENNLKYQRFLCPEGQYNDMATLFYNPQEDAIKMLFHGEAGEDFFLKFRSYRITVRGGVSRQTS